MDPAIVPPVHATANPQEANDQEQVYWSMVPACVPPVASANRQEANDQEAPCQAPPPVRSLVNGQESNDQEYINVRPWKTYLENAEGLPVTIHLFAWKDIDYTGLNFPTAFIYKMEPKQNSTDYSPLFSTEKKGTPTPDWNQEFHLFIKDPDQEFVCIRVCKDNNFNELIGEKVFNLKEGALGINTSKGVFDWFPLMGGKNGKDKVGEIQVFIKLEDTITQTVTAVAMYDYDHPDKMIKEFLSFKAGDKFTILPDERNLEGWKVGVSASGEKGFVPGNFLIYLNDSAPEKSILTVIPQVPTSAGPKPAVTVTAVAMYDYDHPDKMAKDFLSFKAGDNFTILPDERNLEGWKVGVSASGERGFIPGNYFMFPNGSRAEEEAKNSKILTASNSALQTVSAVAMYDYDHPDKMIKEFLSFKAGDKFTILPDERNLEGWKVGVSASGEKGFVPGNFLIYPNDSAPENNMRERNKLH